MTEIEVLGTPVPKGSLRHVGNGRLIEQTKAKPWMGAIKAQALVQVALDRADAFVQFEAPCAVDVTFWFPRPKSAQNRVYPHLRSVGDLDKLCRAVLDALQPSAIGPGILADDSLVVDLTARKRYAQHTPGALIRIEELI